MENEKKQDDFLQKKEKSEMTAETNSLTENNEDEKKSNWKKEIWDFVKVVFIALLITNLLNVFVFTLSQVRQSSMETTLIAGDQLVVEKLSYTFGEPQRGDIVVFIKELSVDTSIGARFIRLYEDMFAKITRKEGHFRLVKRVIGVPGDKVDIHDGKVYVNDKEYIEAYIHQPTYEKSNVYPMIIPAEQYFVMGDNRGMSLDSRDFGCIKAEQIEGKVWIRFWPFNKLGGID
ncbi:signal peptidase I [Clostridiales bacterium COT073_COT-073]|nr:signal peptidase I [Clostridiales bacterium COT073_COT-073]